MKILFLLPPSEGKNGENFYKNEDLSFIFEKPCEIGENVSEKDLKCIGKRFEEGVFLNKNIKTSETSKAIKRYSGVMFNGIDYFGMTEKGQKFFDDNFLILSGMYGILKSSDKIGNYKLPIESKNLYDFWGEKIIEKINDLKVDYVVNLLPGSYLKLILGKNKSAESIFNQKRNFKIININFLKKDGKKISHGVKKIKGEWVKNICEKNLLDFEKFGGNVKNDGKIVNIDLIF